MKRTLIIASYVVWAALTIGQSAMADDQQSFQAKLYGYIKLDGSFDRNITSHGNFVMWVNPRLTGEDDAQFNMTANQSRIGVNLKGEGFGETQVNGKIEFDLYGGVSGATVAQNKALLMLRHAYFTIQSGNTRLLAGQSWDLVSPLNPGTLNYPVLWGCGNIGYRRAQLTLSQTLPVNEKMSATIAGGAFRTIGDDLTPSITLAAGETADGQDDGTDAAIPSVQGRLDVKYTFSKSSNLNWGVSGLWGRLHAATNLGNSKSYESWGAMGHLAVTFSPAMGFSGEIFTGKNLGSYFGGILQKSTVDGVAATGGWASAWWQAGSRVKFSAGLGIDDPEDSDLTSGRSRNSSVFGNVTYALLPQAKVGFELSHWQTDYLGEESAENLRGQTSFILNF